MLAEQDLTVSLFEAERLVSEKTLVTSAGI